MSEIRRIPTKRHRDEYNRWVAFLNTASIRHEDNVDATYGVYEDNRLIATGSIYRNILKCIAVCKDHTGGPVLNQLISFLMSEVMEQGYTTVYVYTKPESVVSFKYLGFKEIATVKDLVFLEKAVHGFDEYLNKLKELAHDKPDSSAIVMNANPFTKGHQYLIEYASQHSEHVYVFVLSEDISEFPAAVRFNLVKAGTAHLKNVEIVETGNYMVSSQTFPSYFLKEEADVTYVHASLDASIFRQVAQVMHITKRFVGEEPYSQATAIYNQALSSILNPEIELEIIPRKEFDHEVISASRVRQALKINDLETVKKLVPETTLEYLVSDEGQHLVHELRNGGKYHDKV